MQRCAHDLGRVNDARLDQAGVFTGLGIKAMVGVLLIEQLAGHDGTVNAGVFGDLPHRRFKSPADNVDTHFLVVVVGFQVLQGAACIE